MKKRNLLLFCSVLSLIFSACGEGRKEPPPTLWYNRPASGWYEALPIGNGHLGAMVYGKTDDELLQLNDNTLYSGEPSTAWKDMDITTTYDEAVAMLREEKYAEATDFLLKNWLGRLHQNYQPLGDWHIRNNSEGEITGYKRELDIANAVLRIGYAKRRGLHARDFCIASGRRHRHASAQRPEGRTGRHDFAVVHSSCRDAENFVRRVDRHERTGARICRTAHF